MLNRSRNIPELWDLAKEETLGPKQEHDGPVRVVIDRSAVTHQWVWCVDHEAIVHLAILIRSWLCIVEGCIFVFEEVVAVLLNSPVADTARERDSQSSYQAHRCDNITLTKFYFGIQRKREIRNNLHHFDIFVGTPVCA